MKFHCPLCHSQLELPFDPYALRLRSRQATQALAQLARAEAKAPGVVVPFAQFGIAPHQLKVLMSWSRRAMREVGIEYTIKSVPEVGYFLKRLPPCD